MTKEIRTIEVLALLNEALLRLDQAHQFIDDVTNLIWDKTAGHLDDEQMMRLATISPEDLQKPGVSA